MDTVTWLGELVSLRTMADGGARVALDVPEDALDVIAAGLLKLRKRRVRIAIASDDDDDESEAAS